MGCNLYTNIEECPLLNISVEYDGNALKKSDKNLGLWENICLRIPLLYLMNGGYR